MARGKSTYASIFTKEFLYQRHVIDQISARKIGKEFGTCHRMVGYYLDYHQIQRQNFIRKMKAHGRWKGCGELSQTRYSGFRSNAKTRKIVFDVSIEELWELFLQQNRKCALSGIEIGFFSSNSASASLDRKDSSRPYTIDNVWWVHSDVNFGKQSLSNEEFIAMCTRVANHNRHLIECTHSPIP